MDQCPACGTDVTSDEDVCAACGTRLQGATASFDALFEPAEAEAAAEVAAADGAVLVVRKGIEVGERFYLEPPRMTIGRDPESSIFLNDVTVSRAHAVLHIEPGTVRIEDVGSLNGTYVNDDIVTDAVLKSGDTVQVGRFQMVFLSGGGA